MASLQKDRESLVQEVDRLNRAKDLVAAESIANLPAACLADLSTESKMREVRESALENALSQIKKAHKGRDDLVQQIEEMEKKQKRAYLKLYDRVGQEIGTKLHKSNFKQGLHKQSQKKQWRKLKIVKLAYLRKLKLWSPRSRI